MCGGTADTFERSDQFMKSYAKTRTLIGGTGAGQTTKTVSYTHLTLPTIYSV